MRLSLDWLRGADGVLGGDLVDQATPIAARDKVQHLVAGLLLALLLRRWTTLEEIAGGLMILLVVAAVAVLWEAFEGLRYLQYRHTVFAADEPDGVDVLVTIAGAALALLLL